MQALFFLHGSHSSYRVLQTCPATKYPITAIAVCATATCSYISSEGHTSTSNIDSIQKYKLAFTHSEKC